MPVFPYFSGVSGFCYLCITSLVIIIMKVQVLYESTETTGTGLVFFSLSSCFIVINRLYHLRDLYCVIDRVFDIFHGGCEEWFSHSFNQIGLQPRSFFQRPAPQTGICFRRLCKRCIPLPYAPMLYSVPLRFPEHSSVTLPDHKAY